MGAVFGSYARPWSDCRPRSSCDLGGDNIFNQLPLYPSREQTGRLGLGMLVEPTNGSFVWKSLNWKVGESGKDRCQIVARGDSQPTAAFYYRENRRNFRPRLWTADVQPVLSTQSHGTHRILRPIGTSLSFG